MYWCYIWLRLQVRLEPAHLGAGFDSGWVRSRQEDAVVHGRLHGISRGRWAEIASQIKYSFVSKQICAKVPTYNEPHAASSTLNEAATATAAFCFLSPSRQRLSEDANMVAVIRVPFWVSICKYFSRAGKFSTFGQGVIKRAFSIARDINSYYDSEKSFMTQKTFPKSVENSFEKINSEYIFVF